MAKNERVTPLLCLEIIGGMIAVFTLMFLELERKRLLPIDLQILQFFYHLRSPLLNTVIINITNLGGEVMVGIGIIVVLLLILKRYWKDALLFTFIVGGTGIINAILKNIFQRTRPQFYPLVIEKDYSFPSGHAMDSFVFYLILSYLLFHITKNKKLSIMATVLSLFLIVLIGISRIYLGVHYPTDVLGGYIAGFAWLVCLLLIQRIFIFYRIFKRTRMV